MAQLVRPGILGHPTSGWPSLRKISIFRCKLAPLVSGKFSARSLAIGCAGGTGRDDVALLTGRDDFRILGDGNQKSGINSPVEAW